MLKTTLFSLTLFLGAANPICAEPAAAEETTNYYEVEYKNFGFFKTIGRKVGALIGYDFLDWNEVGIKTAVAKSTDNARGQITAITVNADSEERLITSLDITGDVPKGFLDITKTQDLRPEGVREFLKAWNYLYDESQTSFELRVSSANLLVDDNGTVHCKFEKTKKDGRYIITGNTFRSNGSSNSDVEITMSADPNPVLEKVTVVLKSGEKIILTLITEPRNEEWPAWE